MHLLRVLPGLQGGDFITAVKDQTGARLSVDRPVGNCLDRVAHIESVDV